MCQVYVISNHETYKPDAKQHFDFMKFQQEMERFRLPRQAFHFVVHKYSMAEDHALAVAYANALRSAVVATLKVDGVGRSRLLARAVWLCAVWLCGGARGHAPRRAPVDSAARQGLPVTLAGTAARCLSALCPSDSPNALKV